VRTVRSFFTSKKRILLNHITLRTSSSTAHSSIVSSKPAAGGPILDHTACSAPLHTDPTITPVLTQGSTIGSNLIREWNSSTIGEEQHIRKEDIMKMLDVISNKRTAQCIRKHIAQLRVRQCEADLRALQQDLFDVDRSLQEMDSSIGLLENLVHQHQVASTATGTYGGVAASTVVPQITTLDTFYDTNSESGMSSTSSSAHSD